MNRSVPTLLGIAILLLVVVLVFSAYNLKLYSRLAQGEVVVGTAGEKALTGVEHPTEQISPSEALASYATKQHPVSSDSKQHAAGKAEKVVEGRIKHEEHAAARKEAGGQAAARKEAGDQTAARKQAGGQKPEPGAK